MKSEESGRIFGSGFNCAQAVFAPYAAERGFAVDEALKIASGFGAGMARTQATCGAVTGGLMALGLSLGFAKAEDTEGRAAMVARGKDLLSGFRAEFGSLLCGGLLGCDLNTEEGQRKHAEDGQRESICMKCVTWASAEVERLIGMQKIT
jgi:C_GCAxxG_C_C family probable redox protein